MWQSALVPGSWHQSWAKLATSWEDQLCKPVEFAEGGSRDDTIQLDA